MLQDLTGLDPKTIPLSDPKVISLFTSPEALGLTIKELDCEVGSYGLPEFGTKFVRQMLLDTNPIKFWGTCKDIWTISWYRCLVL